MTDALDCQIAENLSRCFVAFDYTETKDLLKTALTLISGILVFSIAFGEKIVGLQDTKAAAFRCLATAWIGLILSFICAGAAMTLIALAAGAAIYGQIPFADSSYLDLALLSWACTLASGGLFVASLCLIAIAAVLSVYARGHRPR